MCVYILPIFYLMVYQNPYYYCFFLSFTHTLSLSIYAILSNPQIQYGRRKAQRPTLGDIRASSTKVTYRYCIICLLYYYSQSLHTVLFCCFFFSNYTGLKKKKKNKNQNKKKQRKRKIKTSQKCNEQKSTTNISYNCY